MVSGRGIPGAHEANRRSGNKLAKLTKAAAAIKGDRTQNQMGGGSVLMERGGGCELISVFIASRHACHYLQPLPADCLFNPLT
jgi:hypothetical protein